mmetsp:Transcript_83890/g.259399  ORF Transcript_83890/g.259399 Transcript_83890/m.259399 type:complete len:634 (-) Transcript_83890:303-2204(-)
MALVVQAIVSACGVEERISGRIGENRQRQRLVRGHDLALLRALRQPQHPRIAVVDHVHRAVLLHDTHWIPQLRHVPPGFPRAEHQLPCRGALQPPHQPVVAGVRHVEGAAGKVKPDRPPQLLEAVTGAPPSSDRLPGPQAPPPAGRHVPLGVQREDVPLSVLVLAQRHGPQSHESQHAPRVDKARVVLRPPPAAHAELVGPPLKAAALRRGLAGVAGEVGHTGAEVVHGLHAGPPLALAVLLAALKVSRHERDAGARPSPRHELGSAISTAHAAAVHLAEHPVHEEAANFDVILLARHALAVGVDAQEAAQSIAVEGLPLAGEAAAALRRARLAGGSAPAIVNNAKALRLPIHARPSTEERGRDGLVLRAIGQSHARPEMVHSVALFVDDLHPVQLPGLQVHGARLAGKGRPVVRPAGVAAVWEAAGVPDLGLRDAGNDGTRCLVEDAADPQLAMLVTGDVECVPARLRGHEEAGHHLTVVIPPVGGRIECLQLLNQVRRVRVRRPGPQGRKVITRHPKPRLPPDAKGLSPAAQPRRTVRAVVLTAASPTRARQGWRTRKAEGVLPERGGREVLRAEGHAEAVRVKKGAGDRLRIGQPRPGGYRTVRAPTGPSGRVAPRDENLVRGCRPPQAL